MRNLDIVNMKNSIKGRKSKNTQAISLLLTFGSKLFFR